MLDKLFAIGRALRHGEELSNAATWKNRQIAVNAVAGLLGAAMVFLPMEVNGDDLQTVAAAVAILGGMFNTWATAATSKKVGLSPRRGDHDRAATGDDGAIG